MYEFDDCPDGLPVEDKHLADEPPEQEHLEYEQLEQEHLEHERPEVDHIAATEPLDQQLLRLARNRCELEDRERSLIAEARAYGWSNEDIGKVLGVTRQAIGQKLRRERPRRPGALVLVEQARLREEQRAIAHRMLHEMLRR